MISHASHDHNLCMPADTPSKNDHDFFKSPHVAVDATLRYRPLGPYLLYEFSPSPSSLPPCNPGSDLTPPPASRPINHRLWALNLFEIHSRIVRILEPVEPPEAPIAEVSLRKSVAIIAI